MKKLIVCVLLCALSAFAASPVEYSTTTIANGASLSSAVNIGSKTVLGVVMPAAWTTANLTFQVSYDGTNYANLYDKDGTEYTVTAAASRHIYVEPAQWVGVKYIKVRSGTSGTPVNQGADRSVVLVVRRLD
jgi:hypothetical protein